MYYDSKESETGPLRGTIKPNTHFSVEDEARALRLSVRETNPDAQVIIDILARSLNERRQEIKSHYKQAYGRDLDDDLKKCLTGTFEALCRALLMKPAELDAFSLHKAMIGLGTTESVLIEILVTRSNSELVEIKKIYNEKYGNELEDDIKSDTSGDFRHLLVSLANAKRNECTEVNVTKAVKDAELLVRAGISKYGTDEETFASIMASQAFPQLKAVFHAFEKLANKDIRTVIKAEFAGDAGDCLVAIVDVVRDRNGYFASRIQNALKGLTRNDSTICRIVVSRSEVDLFNIKRAFFSLTNKALVDVLESQFPGESKTKKLLLAIIG